MRRQIYFEMAELRRGHGGATPPPRAVKLIRVRARQRLVAAWSGRPNVATKRVVAAVQPRLAAWLERGWGGFAFRATQVLTGHDCFGDYLCRIGRDRTTRCHHCGEDSALFRPLWAFLKSVLRRVHVCAGGPLAPGGYRIHARERGVMERPPRILRGGHQQEGGGGANP